MGKNKKNIRDEILSRLKTYPEKLRNEHIKEIEDAFFQDTIWTDHQIIGLTLSKFPEIETRGIIERGWKEGKVIVIPKCIPSTRMMEFYQLTDYSALEQVYAGLYEPKPEKSKKIPKHDIETLLVPGIAFTKQGYRIGFGGGYYDRFLIDYTGNTAALAFSNQVLTELPVEKHDIPVDNLFTEEGVYRV